MTGHLTECVNGNHNLVLKVLKRDIIDPPITY